MSPKSRLGDSSDSETPEENRKERKQVCKSGSGVYRELLGALGEVGEFVSDATLDHPTPWCAEGVGKAPCHHRTKRTKRTAGSLGARLFKYPGSRVIRKVRQHS